VNYYDTTKQERCPNSHVSQVAGECYARLLGFDSLYGEAYVRQALASMLRLNFHPRFRAPTNEATPDGHMTARKLWAWVFHSRVYFGGVGFFFGLGDEALRAMQRMDELVTVHNGNNRWDQRLFYEPDTGKEHWGRFYMSAPCTWYVYQALLGYFWDKPSGILGLVPNLPRSLIPFAGPIFTPGFWAWLTVDTDEMRLEIRRVFTQDLPVRLLRLPVAGQTHKVMADGRAVPLTRVESGRPGREDWYACALNLGAIRTLTITELRS